MFIEKVTVDSVIDISEHGKPFINPYYGCTMGCPFCYWLDHPGWEGRIQVRENMPQVLDKLLETWDKNELIYMGSYCDPFMETEREHRLAKACLEIIAKHEVPLLITTSAVTDIILEYIPIFERMRERLILVPELCRLQYLEEMTGGGVHPGIENANKLLQSGFKVWATFAPIMPEVTDLDAILARLDPRIPVYVDQLQINCNTICGNRTIEWIADNKPELLQRYRLLAEQGDAAGFEELMGRYRDNKRICRFPFKLPASI